MLIHALKMTSKIGFDEQDYGWKQNGQQAKFFIRKGGWYKKQAMDKEMMEPRDISILKPRSH